MGDAALFVAEAGADQSCCGDPLVIQRHGSTFPRDLLQRHRLPALPTARHHHVVLALRQELGRRGAELGRQQTKAPVRERLERFVEFYPSILTAARKRPEVVDMRYPKGFALRVNALAAAPENESKGKP